MGEAAPRLTIPDAWAETGCCPFCQAAKLRVQHISNAPDQLTCGRCGAAFELELTGARIRLMAVPAGSALSRAADPAWLSVAEVRAGLRGASPSEAPPAEPASAVPMAPSPGKMPPASPLAEEVVPSPAPAPSPESVAAAGPSPLATCDEAELLTRAEGLLALGNSLRQIQVALERSGVAPEQVQAVMETVRRTAHEKRERQIRSAWVLSGVIIMFVAAAVGAGLWLTHGSGPGSTPSAAPLTALPPTPTGIVGFLLSQPTPVVRTGLPPAASSSAPNRCPTLPGEAAELFGGLSGDWTFKPDVTGWIMTSVIPRDIRVPAGMEAGYFGIGANGASMTTVEGPAAIQGVNFVAITCP